MTPNEKLTAWQKAWDYSEKNKEGFKPFMDGYIQALQDIETKKTKIV